MPIGSRAGMSLISCETHRADRLRMFRLHEVRMPVPFVSRVLCSSREQVILSADCMITEQSALYVIGT
jgi:hypothetical protein